ncbi:uncharacterized protein LOC132698433 isoform X2 [Cylas formicarius]|uniref:uncharacterized protein LOC132698433 isoform X2 n=1 Tax=Cylas formicarius TaxID=197179 RepID=UPI002958D6FE|nr:uncharacterized protein LOC132698433 isoform X2 [Cylas formicarius]
MTELQNNLPSGWDCKLDERSGKYYYVNHYTKTTTWEDPRTRHRPLGTPKHFSNTPVEYIPLQEIKSGSRKSPLTLRSGRVQDSSFSTTNSLCGSDPEESVAKISAMFPTVSETHIKMLLKKYLNREALVISALQVEKYPITTPGPFSTPPPQRNFWRSGSPALKGVAGSPRVGEGFRNSPRPHSSPKLKLRYMKSIFPNADETVILEVLQNNDSNIQKTSETLKEMGYSKKDHFKPATPKPDVKVDSPAGTNEPDQTHKLPAPKMKTSEEKQQMKEKLQDKYKDVAEHLINIALESVNYDESRANQILQIMIQEDTQVENTRKSSVKKQDVKEPDEPNPSASDDRAQIPVSQSRQSIKSILKSDKKDETSSFSRVMDECDRGHFKSTNLRNTFGHNPGFSCGPNEKLLLENYVQWQGPNRALRKGPCGLAKGPDKSLLSTRVYVPREPGAELAKGPSCGSAKGSMFAQFKAVVLGESRVK